MSSEPDSLHGVTVKPLLDHLPNPDDRVGLRGIGQPDTQLVSFSSNIHYGAVHLYDG